MAGNRTRVNCLEGSYAHHYTTIAPYSIYYIWVQFCFLLFAFVFQKIHFKFKKLHLRVSTKFVQLVFFQLHVDISTADFVLLSTTNYVLIALIVADKFMRAKQNFVPIGKFAVLLIGKTASWDWNLRNLHRDFIDWYTIVVAVAKCLLSLM